MSVFSIENSSRERQ